MPMIHEVIDHNHGVTPGKPGQPYGLKHIFFDSEAEARRYIEQFTAKRYRDACSYLHRDWHPDVIAELKTRGHVDDRRTVFPEEQPAEEPSRAQKLLHIADTAGARVLPISCSRSRLHCTPAVPRTTTRAAGCRPSPYWSTPHTASSLSRSGGGTMASLA